MPKNIVVCCDGTANEFARDRTNVVKLFHALVKDPAVQACYYHPGVGTMAAPGFVTTVGRKLAEMAGLVFGYGLNDDIADAYLSSPGTSSPATGFFLFGSAAAPTRRAPSPRCCIVRTDSARQRSALPYAVRLMWAIRNLGERPRMPRRIRGSNEYFDLADRIQGDVLERVQAVFRRRVGQVSSVGWFASPLSLPYTANNPTLPSDATPSPSTSAAPSSTPTFGGPRPVPDVGPEDMKQVWFPGVHGDIGGGYPEARERPRQDRAEMDDRRSKAGRPAARRGDGLAEPRRARPRLCAARP